MGIKGASRDNLILFEVSILQQNTFFLRKNYCSLLQIIVFLYILYFYQQPPTTIANSVKYKLSTIIFKCMNYDIYV